MSIPKIIWQTYKTEYKDLPEKAKRASETWINMNPDYEYRYMSDENVFKFVEENFDKNVLELMKSFKVNVMKADLWRYLVTYTYGGLYTDIDTVCNIPISNWLDNEKNMIVAPENGMHYAQWTFATAQGSPIVKNIIDLVLKRCESIDYEKPSFVHYYTANDVFTEGIRSYFDLPSLSHECESMRVKFNCECDLLQSEAMSYAQDYKMSKAKFFCFSGVDWDIFRTVDPSKAVNHLFGSQNWADGSYEQWTANELAAKSRANFDIGAYQKTNLPEELQF